MIVLRWIKLFIKAILMLLILPFLLIYIASKYACFKYNFCKEVKAYGVSKKNANLLISEMSPFAICKK